MSITDDLDDIYEEFLALTSSSSSSVVSFSPDGYAHPPPPHPPPVLSFPLPETYNYDNNYWNPPPQDGHPEDMNYQQWRIPGQPGPGQFPNLGYPWLYNDGGGNYLYNHEYLYNRSRLEYMMTSGSAVPPPPPPPRQASPDPVDVKPTTVAGGILNYPTGLDVLFRQVPPGARPLLLSSDICDSAIQRGYFTVAELLGLKRLLISRYTGQPFVKGNAERSRVGQGTRRGVKRSHEDKPQAEFEKVSVIRSTHSVGGVGGVVKEAMTILHDQQGSSSGSTAASAQ